MGLEQEEQKIEGNCLVRMLPQRSPAHHKKIHHNNDCSKEQSEEEDNDTDDDSYFAEFGLLFESHHPVRVETFRWETATTTTQQQHCHIVKVTVNDDDTPGCLASGLYLWPASIHLAEYITKHLSTSQVRSVVELGAGCGLVSLTALQVWQNTLQCLVITDQDPNTLARARDNLESTMQALINAAEDDDESLNVVINSVASIPVAFESLEWGETAVETILRNQIQEHSDFAQAHMVLGSDLIYDISVVEPLLRSVHDIMAPTGSCLLAQSTTDWNNDVEQEIRRVCTDLQLTRRLVEEKDGICRIEEFTHHHQSDL